MADSNEFQQLIQVLMVRMDRQEKQQESMFNLHQNFQKSQGKFGERLKRPEDFMDGFMRKAG